MRGGRRHSRGPAMGPQFPSSLNTGATLTPVTSVNVPSGATSGTGWSWNAGTSTVTATASVSGLNVAGSITVTGTSATLSNCVAAAQVTISASGVTVTTCTTGAVVISTSGLTGILVEQCTIASPGGECIELNALPTGVNGLTIRDCTISGLDAGAGRSAYGIDDNRGNTTSLLIQRCSIYWCRLGISVTAGTIRDCYIHDFGYVQGDHTDGIANGGTGGLALDILHNAILMNRDETSPLPLGGSGAYLQNVTVQNNLLAGGDYCAYLGLQGGDNLRTDSGCTISGGTTLTDSNLLAGDAGCTVTGTGIPPFTTIGTPSGTTATLSQACTNGTVTVTLHYTSGILVTGNRFSRMFYYHAGTFAPAVDYDSTVASNVWDAGNVFHDDWTSAPS